MFPLPDQQSDGAAEDEEDVPEPEDEVDLVNDDVEAQDAESVEFALFAPRSILIIRTAGHSGERFTHWIAGILQQQLLGRKRIKVVDICSVRHKISA